MDSIQSLSSFTFRVTSFYQPTIMVASSPSASSILSRNLLTVPLLFAPFGDRFSDQFTIQPRLDLQPFMLKGFGVRFAGVEEVKEASGSAKVEAALEESLKVDVDGASIEKIINEPWRWREKEELENIKKDDFVKEQTPWFESYRWSFQESLRYSEEDYLDQPLGYIMVVSSQDADPLSHFDRMAKVKSLPSLFNSCYDQNTFRMCIILHDAQSSEEFFVKATNSLKDIKKFLPSSKLLVVNSLSEISPNLNQKDIWAPFIHRSPCAFLSANVNFGDEKSFVRANSGSFSDAIVDDLNTAIKNGIIDDPLSSPLISKPVSTSVRGAFLSKEDLESIGQSVKEFVKGMLSHVEKRFWVLHEQVGNSRKGFGNRFKAMFSRKSKEGMKYELTSIESQTRQLADLAFIFQDYDTAIEHYQMCLADYKQDKAWRSLASCSEFLAMSMCLNAIWTYIENYNHPTAANSAALKNGLLSYVSKRDVESSFDSAFHTYNLVGDTRRATRSVLFSVDAYKLMPGKLRDSGACLLRASERESNLRSALLLEQAAFTFLLSETQSFLTPVLIRKYAFHLIMAGHLFNKCVNQRSHAVRCYHSALNVYSNKGWDHIEDHVHFILGRQCFAKGDVNSSVNHFLPLICTGRQNLDRQNTFLREFIFVMKKFYVTSTVETVLRKLQLPKFEDSSLSVTTLDDHLPASLASSIWTKTLRSVSKSGFSINAIWPTRSNLVAVVNEPLYLRINIFNPLLVDLEVADLMLCCTMNSGQNLNSLDNPKSLDFTKSTTLISPNSSASVELVVVPQAVGNLKIEGVSWMLFGLVRGYHAFELPPRRLFTTKEQRKSRQYAPDTSLLVPVISKAAHIRVDLNLKKDFITGEISRFTLVLTNTGLLPVSKFSILCNLPSFVCMLDDSDESFFPVHKEQACKSWNSQCSIVLDEGIESGESKTLQFMFRSFSIGAFSLEFMIRYFYTNDTESSRIIYLVHPLRVNPGLRFSSFSRPSFDKLCDHIVGIEIENESLNDETFEIVQVVAFSSNWQLSQFSSINMFAVPSKETKTGYYRVSSNIVISPPVSPVAKNRMSSTGQNILSSDFYEETSPLLQLINAERQVWNTELDLCIVWKCRSVYGLSYIFNAPLKASTAPSACPLRVVLSCPQALNFNFNDISNGLSCTEANVSITVRNSSDVHVWFVFETLPPEEEFDPSSRSFRVRTSNNLSGRYFWKGQTRRRIGLGPGNTVDIKLTACIFASGVFNLNRFRFNLETDGNAPRVFFFPLQHLVFVNYPVHLTTMKSPVELKDAVELL